ncbi:MAG: Y-family DNA polymerase [Phycisphaerales bacterium]
MRRIISVFLPMWPIDRIRRQQRAGQRSGVLHRENGNGKRSCDGPIFVVHTQANRQSIVTACAVSLAHGVRAGMTLAHARALVPGDRLSPRVYEHDPVADQESLLALARWAVRIAPRVATDPTCNGLLLDVSGCERLYQHNERRLLNSIANRLERCGLTVRLAAASTAAAARAVARFARHQRVIVPAGEERQALADLPIQALDPAREQCDELNEVGIHTIGQLLDVPRLHLAARHGNALLHTLDQALGEAIEVITPVSMPEQCVAEQVFDGPLIQIEGVTACCRTLLASLIGQLLQREAGAMEIHLTCTRVDASPLREIVRLSHPSRDEKHLWSLLQPRLETLHLGYGLETMALTAVHIGPLVHQQLLTQQQRDQRCGDDEEHDDRAASVSTSTALGQLIDTFTQRLGSGRVHVRSAVASHLPERTWQAHAASHAVAGGRFTDSSSESATLALTHGSRPSQLLATPEPVAVTTLSPHGPLLSITWRAQFQQIITTVGPERIADEWWRTAAMHSNHRDYYRVETAAGRWLWLFRSFNHGTLSGMWYVHGIWA